MIVSTFLTELLPSSGPMVILRVFHQLFLIVSSWNSHLINITWDNMSLLHQLSLKVLFENWIFFSFHSPMHKGLKIVLAYSLNVSGWQNVKDIAQKSLKKCFLFSRSNIEFVRTLFLSWKFFLKYFSHLSSKYKHQNGSCSFFLGSMKT